MYIKLYVYVWLIFSAYITVCPTCEGASNSIWVRVHDVQLFNSGFRM